MAWTNTGGNLRGPKGDAGAPGSQWLTGTGAPAAGVGADGDFYISDQGEVYGPKTAGAWGPVKFTVQGAEGPAGVVSATAPLNLNASKVLSIAVGSAAGQVAAGDHTHAQYLARDADSAMDAGKFLSVNPPTNDGHAATKKYVDEKVTSLAGGVSLVGSYNASTNKVTQLATGITGYTVGQALPAAAAANKGNYFILDTSGTGTAPAPTKAMEVGDWIVSNGADWVHVPIGDAYRQVFYQDTQPSGTDFLVGNIWVKTSTQEIYVKDSPTTVVKVKADPTAHNHTIAEVTGLQTALDAKAAVGSTAGAALAATAAAGTATTAARSDHVHPLPTAAQVGAAAATHTHADLDEVKIAATAPTDTTSELWVNSANGEVKYKSGGTWQNILTGNGPQGQRGTGWHVGAGAPTTVAGSITGDLYLDTTTGNVYRLD